MDLPRRYRYGITWWTIIGCCLLFGSGCAVMVRTAVHNTAGVIIDGLITLGPDGATVLFWCLAAVSAGFVLVVLVGAVRLLAYPLFLELDSAAAQLPHGFFQRHTAHIAYVDIQAVEERLVGRQALLNITAGGRTFILAASLLPDQASYAEVRDFLVTRGWAA